MSNWFPWLGIVAGIGLGFHFSTPAASTECRCDQHKAKATAEGACSKTEDPQICTMSFNNRINNAITQQKASRNLDSTFQSFVGPLSAADSISRAFDFFDEPRDRLGAMLAM